MLRKIVVLVIFPAIALAACNTLPGFRGASVLYQTPSSIGVRYDYAQSTASVLTGQSPDDNEKKAMALIVRHCKGKFKVTGRNQVRGFTTIDAVCG